MQQPAMSDLLVLDHLAASWGCTAGGGKSSSDAGSSSSLALASARRFVCCRMLHDALLAASQEGGSEGELDPKVVTLLLVQHRKLQDSQLPLLGECPSCKSGFPRALCMPPASACLCMTHCFQWTLPDCHATSSVTVIHLHLHILRPLSLAVPPLCQVLPQACSQVVPRWSACSVSG